MKNLIWKDKYQKRLFEAYSPVGRWTMSRTNVVEIGFVPDPPNGLSFIEAYELLKDHHGEEKHTEEYQRLAASVLSSARSAMAENFEEAKLFVETIRRGDAKLPPAIEQLQAASFTQSYPQHESLSGLYGKRIKSGTLDVHLHDDDDCYGLYSRYHGDGCNSWHNVCSIFARHRGQGEGKGMLYNFFPDKVMDIQRVGVAHVIAIMKLRLARSRKRFSTPLGGGLPKERY
jgi:hypothetical protein